MFDKSAEYMDMNTKHGRVKYIDILFKAFISVGLTIFSLFRLYPISIIINMLSIVVSNDATIILSLVVLCYNINLVKYLFLYSMKI